MDRRKEHRLHDVLALKGNHETALEEVSSFLLDAKSRKNFGGAAHDFYESP